MVLGLIQSFLVSYPERSTLVGQFLTLSFEALVFFKVDRLFVLLGLESDSVSGQIRFELIDANQPGLFVFIQGAKPCFNLIDTSLQHCLVTRTAAQCFLSLFFLPLSTHSKEVGSVHAFTQMLRASRLQGLFGSLMGLLCT